MVGVIKDLYPETLFDAKGISRTHPLFRLFRWMDRRAFRRSALITVLNPTQREYLIADRGVAEDRVQVFHDWVDASEYRLDAARDGVFRSFETKPRVP